MAPILRRLASESRQPIVGREHELAGDVPYAERSVIGAVLVARSAHGGALLLQQLRQRRYPGLDDELARISSDDRVRQRHQRARTWSCSLRCLPGSLLRRRLLVSATSRIASARLGPPLPLQQEPGLRRHWRRKDLGYAERPRHRYGAGVPRRKDSRGRHAPGRRRNMAGLGLLHNHGHLAGGSLLDAVRVWRKAIGDAAVKPVHRLSMVLGRCWRRNSECSRSDWRLYAECSASAGSGRRRRTAMNGRSSTLCLRAGRHRAQRSIVANHREL